MAGNLHLSEFVAASAPEGATSLSCAICSIKSRRWHFPKLVEPHRLGKPLSFVGSLLHDARALHLHCRSPVRIPVVVPRLLNDCVRVVRRWVDHRTIFRFGRYWRGAHGASGCWSMGSSVCLCLVSSPARQSPVPRQACRPPAMVHSDCCSLVRGHFPFLLFHCCCLSMASPIGGLVMRAPGPVTEGGSHDRSFPALFCGGLFGSLHLYSAKGRTCGRHETNQP